MWWNFDSKIRVLTRDTIDWSTYLTCKNEINHYGNRKVVHTCVTVNNAWVYMGEIKNRIPHVEVIVW